MHPVRPSGSARAALAAIVLPLVAGGAHAQEEDGAQSPDGAGDLVIEPQRPSVYAPPAAPPAPPSPDEPTVDVGGALRFSTFIKTWGRPVTIHSGGDAVAFDTFALDVESAYRGFELAAQYRFYAGYNMLKHGYLAYVAPERLEVSLGLMRVPFGLLPYASHSWFFDLTYYVGLEDDYDLGVRVDYDLGAVDLQLAYFRNDEGSYTGSSRDSARYSYDVVTTDETELPGLDGTRRNGELHQGNVRVVWTLSHGEGHTELGVSGQIGGVENGDTHDIGLRWAAAVHLHGRYGPIDVQLQGLRYGYALANPPGQDERFVTLGAYDAPYRVAARAYMGTANVAWVIEVDRPPIDSVTFYNDFSLVAKLEDDFADTYQNVTGTLLHAGPVYAYVDAALGRNHPWVGPNYAGGLAEGEPGAEWEARFNVNVGYYF